MGASIILALIGSLLSFAAAEYDVECASRNYPSWQSYPPEGGRPLTPEPCEDALANMYYNHEVMQTRDFRAAHYGQSPDWVSTPVSYPNCKLSL